MTQKRTIYFSVFVLAVLTFFHYVGWLNGPENLFQNVLSRASGLVYNFSTTLRNFSERRLSFNNLFEQNQACVSKLRSLTVNQAELKQVKEENSILRAQLNFVKSKKSFVTADVVGKEAGLSNVVIINRGETDGLKIDQPVIAGEGFLVGKIVKVGKNVAFIRLLSDNQSKIAAMILSKNITMGVVSGEHGLSLKLGMVPQTEELNAGDEVVTSGLEQNMPRGLLIGKIKTVQKEAYEPFQSAALEPFVDLAKLTIVTVLTD
ncbi:MAG: rod shape-determining protein MreC [Patescibacteria group bacterium]